MSKFKSQDINVNNPTLNYATELTKMAVHDVINNETNE